MKFSGRKAVHSDKLEDVYIYIYCIFYGRSVLLRSLGFKKSKSEEPKSIRKRFGGCGDRTSSFRSKTHPQSKWKDVEGNEPVLFRPDLVANV